MKNVFYMLSALIVSVLLVSGCASNVTTQSDGKLNVIVSILPQKAFVNAVGGNHVTVNELIPPGASPATYEPKPSDLALVENADIYFRIGHIPFEKSHADKLAELNPDMEIIDTSVNVELRHFGEHEAHSHEHEEEHEEHEEEHEDEHEEEHDHAHEGVDPHVWLSPKQVKHQVDVIADTLSKNDPENSEVYKSNAESFKQELDTLHLNIGSKFVELETDKLMVFHPAWGYFADEYGLEQVAIEQSGKEPTAEQIQHLIDEAREEDVKVIFVQSQFNKEIAESIAEEIGAVVVSIDPLSEDYLNNLRAVAITISEQLKK